MTAPAGAPKPESLALRITPAFLLLEPVTSESPLAGEIGQLLIHSMKPEPPVDSLPRN